MKLVNLKIVTKSKINRTHFTNRNVTVTPIKCFDLFYNDGEICCNVLNWNKEHNCHAVDILSTAIVDNNPLYIIETVEVECDGNTGHTLSSRSFKTIAALKEVL
jgi:hypothetical protein